MNTKPLPICIVSLILLCGNQLTIAQQTQLVRILPKGEKSRVGVLLQEDAQMYRIHDLKTDERIDFQKEKVRSVRTDLSFTSAAKKVGLANIIAWKINQEFLTSSKPGKIANVDGPLIFVTIGEKSGVREGDALEVYRGESLIKDPDTGETLGVKRRKIAKLVVIEVREKFSKAKLHGELEVEIKSGDIVERSVINNSLAIIPFVNVAGAQTVAGNNLAESLQTELVQHKVPILDRKRLDAVIAELAIQQTRLFDVSQAQDIGRQIGARGILTGTIVSGRRKDVAQIRLIEVGSGKILFSLEHEMEGPATEVASRSGNPVVLSGTFIVNWQPRGTTKFQIQGDKTFTFYNNGKHLCKTGQLRDGSLTCERPDGNLTVFRRQGNKIVAESYPSRQHLNSGKSPTLGVLK